MVNNSFQYIIIYIYVRSLDYVYYGVYQHVYLLSQINAFVERYLDCQIQDKSRNSGFSSQLLIY